MDWVAFLSTVVLVATIATSIFAVAAYAISRGLTRRRPAAAAASGTGTAAATHPAPAARPAGETQITGAAQPATTLRLVGDAPPADAPHPAAAPRVGRMLRWYNPFEAEPEESGPAARTAEPKPHE